MSGQQTGRERSGAPDPPDPATQLTVAIRVSPASARTAVGGRRAGALVVRVTEAPVDGRATEAALVAVSRALGVRRRDVELRTGASSRDKIVTVSAADDDVRAKLAALMTADAKEPRGRRHPP